MPGGPSPWTDTSCCIDSAERCGAQWKGVGAAGELIGSGRLAWGRVKDSRVPQGHPIMLDGLWKKWQLWRTEHGGQWIIRPAAIDDGCSKGDRLIIIHIEIAAKQGHREGGGDLVAGK